MSCVLYGFVDEGPFTASIAKLMREIVVCVNRYLVAVNGIFFFVKKLETGFGTTFGQHGIFPSV